VEDEVREMEPGRGESHPDEDRESIRRRAVEAAVAAGCVRTVPMPGGAELSVPMFLMAEAAVAAAEGLTELEWRRAWVRRHLLRVAEHPDNDGLVAEVVTVINATEHIIADLDSRGVWPWDRRPLRRAG
jgi:hypothetical protein